MPILSVVNAFETTMSTVQKDNKVIVHHCKLETKICSSFAQKLEVPNPHNSNDLEVLQNRSREACWNSTFYDVGSEIRVTAWDSYNTCRKWDNRYMQWYKLYIPVNRCKLSEPSTVSECLLFCNLQLQPHWGTTFQWISGLSSWKHAWNTGWPWSMDNLGVESKIPRWYLKAQTTKWMKRIQDENNGKSGLFNESTKLQTSLSCHVPSSNNFALMVRPLCTRTPRWFCHERLH